MTQMNNTLDNSRDPELTAALALRLIERGLVPAEVMDAAVSVAGRLDVPLGKYLIEHGLVERHQLYDGTSREERPEYWDLATAPPMAKALKLLPVTFARKYGVVPVKLDGKNLLLAMPDPRNIGIIDNAAMVSGKKIIPVYSPQVEIDQCISQCYNSMTKAANELTDAVKKAAADKLLRQDLSEKGIEFDESSPMERLIDELLERAVSQQVSDIHVEPERDHLRIRFRIDGVLREEMRISKENQARIISRLKIMAGIDITETRKPQDGSYSRQIGGGNFDFRVVSLPGVYGEHIVYRVLRKDMALLTLTKLGFSPLALERLEFAYHKPYGTILVTGPTGSGKTTTLYSIINELNTVGRNIVTAENPVEYRIDGITQCETNPKAGFTFANALRSFLRSDPNVILVGEIRDNETAEIAMEAALTGHLVLSTLHTNDSAIAVPRLREMDVPSFIIASSLDAVVAQRLARKLCVHCKKEASVDELELLAAGFGAVHLEGPVFMAGRCKKCGGTGYAGRTVICEVMTMSEQIRELVLSSAGADQIRDMAMHEGMVPMRQDAILKVAAGITSISEALRVTV